MKPIRTAASLKIAWKRAGTSFITFIERLDRKGIPYLSHSKLTLIETCPGCYYRQYVLREKDSFPAMELGTLFHRAAKQFYAGCRNGLILKPTELLTRKQTAKLSKVSLQKLTNAVTQLRAHHWEDHEVVSYEEPFFMDLASSLPPVIGIPDLVLHRKGSLIVVDHKTSKKFNDLDPAQLILYAEHIRRQHKARAIIGVFDEYRTVDDLTTIKKPAFRRTPVSVDPSLLPDLILRYRNAWKQIIAIDSDGKPSSSPDCWFCNSANGWY